MRGQATFKFGLLFRTGMQVYIVGKRVPDRVHNTQPFVNGKVGHVRDRLIDIHSRFSKFISGSPTPSLAGDRMKVEAMEKG